MTHAPSEHLDVPTDGGHLDAGLVLPDGPSTHAVILCHGLPSGSARDPSDPGYPGLARDLAARGMAAAHFSFRGCYGSPGNFSISGWIQDLGAVVDAVVERVPGRPLGLAASSLGGAVALAHAARDERVRFVATLATPAVLDELADGETRSTFLDRVRGIGLIRDPDYPSDVEAWGREFLEFRPADAAGRLGPRPLLVLHGTADDVVPVEHARRLAIPGGMVTRVVLEGAGHQLRRDPTAVRVLYAWLALQDR